MPAPSESYGRVVSELVTREASQRNFGGDEEKTPTKEREEEN